jgi:hypothetical protein
MSNYRYRQAMRNGNGNGNGDDNGNGNGNGFWANVGGWDWNAISGNALQWGYALGWLQPPSSQLDAMAFQTELARQRQQMMWIIVGLIVLLIVLVVLVLRKK